MGSSLNNISIYHDKRPVPESCETRLPTDRTVKSSLAALGKSEERKIVLPGIMLARTSVTTSGSPPGLEWDTRAR